MPFGIAILIKKKRGDASSTYFPFFPSYFFRRSASLLLFPHFSFKVLTHIPSGEENKNKNSSGLKRRGKHWRIFCHFFQRKNGRDDGLKMRIIGEHKRYIDDTKTMRRNRMGGAACKEKDGE